MQGTSKPLALPLQPLTHKRQPTVGQTSVSNAEAHILLCSTGLFHHTCN